MTRSKLILGGFVFSMICFSGCSDPAEEPATPAGGGNTSVAGQGGSHAGGGSGGTAQGGGGSGGTAQGGGGSGGTAQGGGGSGGGGTGGGGAGGTGGGGAGGGGNASAACMTWCVGGDSVIEQCAGMLPAAIDTEAKCLAVCETADTGDLGCWNDHRANVITMGTGHCGHATGATGNGVCPEL